jgi:hypothetical protein
VASDRGANQVFRVAPSVVIAEMQLFHVTYQIPAEIPPAKAAKLTSSVDTLLHALRPPPGAAAGHGGAPMGGKLVQLAQGPQWLLPEMLKLSPDLRVLIVPRDPQQPFLAHPAELRPMLQVDRGDWELTCLRFSKTAATLPARRSLLSKIKEMLGS